LILKSEITYTKYSDETMKFHINFTQRISNLD
jgi:hypothetical protein